MPAVIGSFLARYWPYVAGAALIVAAWIGFNILQNKLDAAQAQRDKAMVQLQVSNASIKAMQSDIDRQNAAITQLGVESDKRLLEGRALILDEVRKGVAASQTAAKLSAQPKTGGDQSKSSEAVMAARSLL